MATSSIQSNTTLFDQIIFTFINDLKNKHKRADLESIHKEIAKKSDFKNVTKEDLEDRINILEGSCIDLITTSRPSLHQFSQVFETGMSDHRSMIYTMLKSTYTRSEPKILRNRSYKDFYEECFLQDLQHGLSNNGNYSDFNNEFKEILNHHAPIKQTKVRGNTKPHINKALCKEIMKRSRLKNKANKSGNKEDDKRL